MRSIIIMREKNDNICLDKHSQTSTASFRRLHSESAAEER